MSEYPRRNYRNPTPTVDIIIEFQGGIVLIERRNPPWGWALPGGFVDVGEPLHRAAAREAKEETSLEIELVEQFFCYSDPSRDTRQHTITTVYLARASGELAAADDAKNIGVFREGDLPRLVFDHGEIVADYFRYRKDGTRPGPTR